MAITRIIGIPGSKFPKELRAKLSEAHKGKFGEKSSHWKGGRRVTNNGYVLLTINGKEIREHRLVMSQSIGRELLPDEIVHHKNGNPSDNRLINLEIVSRADHVHLHPKTHTLESRKKMSLAQKKRRANGN